MKSFATVSLCLAASVPLACGSVVPFWSQRSKPSPCGKSGKKRLLCDGRGTFTGMEILIDILVGGQHQRVQFDTGSSDLALYSKQCGNCGNHTLSPYDTTSSGVLTLCNTTECAGRGTQCYKDNHSAFDGGCSYKNSYGDGSGFLAIVHSDSFSVLGEAGSINMRLGAIIDQHGGPGQPSFEGPASDGILGTGFMPISSADPNAKYNPVVALAKAQGKPGLFSMCFAKDGGAFGIGDVLPYYTGNFVIEPLVLDRKPASGFHGYWSVRVVDVKVYGKSLGVEPSVYTQNDCIVDSGTTVMGLPQQAFDAFVDAVLARCNETSLVGTCVDLAGNRIDPSEDTLLTGRDFALKPEDVAFYPSLEIVMTNSSVSVTPESYIQCIEDDGKNTCVSMVQEMEDTMLGDGFLAGLVTVYDQDSMHVRFAKSEGCPTPNSLTAAQSSIVVV